MSNDWVKVGAEVASVCFGQHKSVVRSKIDRIGKVWLFLENGEKFHILGLDRAEGPVVGGRTYRLFPTDHPRVREIELDIQVKRVMQEASKAAAAFVDDPSVENAERAVLALIPFTKWHLVDTINS